MKQIIDQTIISGEESVEVTKFMIRSIFNSIAYIREFFPEECFKDSKTKNGLKMKDILRGQSVEVDRYIDWIQCGCFDALERKYLRSIKMAIYENPNLPERIMESYEIMITYPNSPEHMNGKQIDKMEKSMKSKLSIHIPCNDEYKNNQKEGEGENQISYTNQCIKVLRLLCVLIQTLNDLPEMKYISMELSYWDELTPANYEPPMFTSPIFDADLHFQNPKSTYKHSFGSVGSGSHRLSLALETAFADIQTPPPPPPPLLSKNKEAEATRSTAEKPAQIQEKHSQLLENQPELSLKLQSQADSAPVSQLNIPPAEKQQIRTEETMKVRCLCKDSESDLDMIQCDSCRSWIHTPCAGFCTNNDKRIPNVFICHSCEFKGNTKLLMNIRNLALLRRSISLIYSEGWVNITTMSKRLSCTRQLAWKILSKMEKEGFVTRIFGDSSKYSTKKEAQEVLSPSQDSILSFKFIINRTQKVKERIKHFFSLDLSVFPELQVFFPRSAATATATATLTKKPPSSSSITTATNTSTSKKRKSDFSTTRERKSITQEKVSCIGY